MNGLAYEIKRILERLRRKEGAKEFLKCSYYEILSRYIYPATKKSYSTLQDVYIDELLGFPQDGFYVDIGAYLPKLGNHTQRFYNKGWRGINIDANPESITLFERARPGDINLNVGVSETEETLVFYKFFPNSLSSFSETAYKSNREAGFEFLGTREIKVFPIKKILEEYATEKEIAFMNIDTEGLELKVLKGNDWNKFKPKVICIESSSDDNAIKDFLEDKEYSLQRKIFNNNFYFLSS